MHAFLALAVALELAAAGARPPSDDDPWRWARQLGGPARDFALDVACDPSGGVVVGGGSDALGPAGEHLRSAFVTALDRSGVVRWSHVLPELDGAYAVAVDGAGNTFVATLDLAGAAVAPGYEVASFVTKYGPQGERRWHLRLEIAPRVLVADVASDAAGNLYVAGELTPEGRAAGLSTADAFVTKLDPAGRVLWTRTLATDRHDAARAVAVDARGGVHVAGVTEGDLAGEAAGRGDAFAARLGPDGDVEWKVQLGSEWDDEATAVAPGPRGGTLVLRGARRPEGAVWSVVAHGRPGTRPLWERTVAEAAAEARGLAVAPSGEIVVAIAQPARSGLEAEVVALDARGERRWTSMTHAPGDQIPAAVAVDSRGAAFVVGTTEGAFQGLTLSGVADAFVLKLGPGGRPR